MDTRLNTTSGLLPLSRIKQTGNSELCGDNRLPERERERERELCAPKAMALLLILF